MADPNQMQNNAEKSIEDELEDYLATNNQGMSSSNGGASTQPVMPEEPEEEIDPIMKGDLLSQIAAEDIKNEEEEKKKAKKQISFSKLFAIFIMRATLMIDEIRHKYASTFRMFELVWCVLIALIYVGGLISLGILVYAYANYPRYVADYFRKSGIELASWDMDSYTLSRIELSNLKSKDGLYTIKRVVIRSPFSDFLRGRIKSVNLEGTTLTIRERGDKLEISKLIGVLAKMNQSAATGHKIGSISIPNAVLNIEGKNFKLPLHLSVNGVYENTPNVSIPITIKQDYMNISALLSLGGNARDLEWTLDILSGTLSFPNRQPENISGKFKIKMRELSLSSLNGTLDMVYGKNTKKIKLDFRDNKGTYRGSIGLTLLNLEVRDKADETKTEMQIIFDGLDFKNLSHIITKQSVRVNIQSLYTQDFSVMNASTTLRGEMDCKDFVCSYYIKSPVPVSVQSTRLVHAGNTYNSTESSTLTLTANNRKNIVWDGSQLKFDLSIADANYKGTKNTSSNPIEASATTMELLGTLSDKNSQSSLQISATGANYSSNDTSFSNADFEVDNVWDGNTALRFASPSVLLKNNRLLKVPFAIDMRREKGMLGAALGVLDNKIQIRYAGTANLLSGVFQGNMAVLPFDLKDIPGNLQDVSDIFPGFAKKASGKLAAYGRILWRNEKQVSGPFYLMVENVGFKTGNMEIKNMNALLVVQSLVPFITTAGQEVFVGGIDSILPFRNINAVLKFDNQMMRIARMNTNVGGIKLNVDNLIVPYRSNATTVYLKNSQADLTDLNGYWKMKDFSVIEGEGDITLPIDLKDGQLSLNNGEIRIFNARLGYNGNNRRIRNALFKNSNEYLLRSGTIQLTQGKDNILNAYLNFEGRMLPDQIKTNYSDTIRINPKDILSTARQEPIPALIAQRQQLVKTILKKQE